MSATTQQIPDYSGLARPVKGSGARQSPARIQARSDIARAESQAVEPSAAQAEANNFKSGHASFRGLRITVQVPNGGTRKGIGPDGKSWETKGIRAAYGQLKGTKAADGENVDIILGTNPHAENVFLIDQIDQSSGKYDETKAALGFASQEEALGAYDSLFSDQRSRERVGAVSSATFADFKKWIRSSAARRPYSKAMRAYSGLARPAKQDSSPEGWNSIAPQINQKEWELLRREKPRLQEAAAQHTGSGDASNIPFRHAVMGAFAAHSSGGAKRGLYIGVRRIFNRLGQKGQ